MKIKRRSKTTVKKKRKRKPLIEFISTACLVLNLALSGKGRRGGIARGRILNIVGDGSTGKTLLVLEIAAWCFYNMKRIASRIFGKVKKVIIVYNNVEGVMDFPLELMFGPKFAKSIEWIRISVGEALGRDLTRRVNALQKGEMLLYIVDSWDGVKPEEESEHFEKEAEKDKKISEGYAVSMQKYTHKLMRNICDKIYGKNYAEDYDYKLDQKDVTIIITSQIRYKINATAFEKDTYRIGGKAFDFWTHQVLWLYHAGKLKDEVMSQKNIYGIKVRAVVERSKVYTPWEEARFPILWNHGIDNIGSMVDYLFGPQKKSYSWHGISGRKVDFIRKIIDAELEDELKLEVIRHWNDKKRKSAEKHYRRPKYHEDIS